MSRCRRASTGGSHAHEFSDRRGQRELIIARRSPDRQDRHRHRHIPQRRRRRLVCVSVGDGQKSAFGGQRGGRLRTAAPSITPWCGRQRLWNLPALHTGPRYTGAAKIAEYFMYNGKATPGCLTTTSTKPRPRLPPDVAACCAARPGVEAYPGDVFLTPHAAGLEEPAKLSEPWQGKHDRPADHRNPGPADVSALHPTKRDFESPWSIFPHL